MSQISPTLKMNLNITAVAVRALHQEMSSIMHTLFDACTPRRDVLEEGN